MEPGTEGGFDAWMPSLGWGGTGEVREHRAKATTEWGSRPVSARVSGRKPPFWDLGTLGTREVGLSKVTREPARAQQ